MSDNDNTLAAESAPAAPPAKPIPWSQLAFGAVAVLAVAGLGMAWFSHSRLQMLERELVSRQASSQGEASEARAQSRQAQELSRDTAAKVALLDARLAEVALQRSQLEELIQSMSRSRDENVIGDIEASIRVALQQSAITGSAEPLVSALRQADERLARNKQPRMEGVRRAVVRDLDRVKSVSVVDVATLAIKLDEVARLLDELPLLASADKSDAQQQVRDRRVAKPAAKPASGNKAADSSWWDTASERWQEAWGLVWNETRSLIRVTRVEHPEAMLLAPDQRFFLRENLKLRLLNARLALLSRQYDSAQADLRDVQGLLERYFDSQSRKVGVATELLRQVQGQARQVVLPRPDDTLAALTAAVPGR
ncbi:uroporphyrinogen-III C-methyltransferase [Pelomonas sp. SE-A7]|uniref:uroporphyrinogen-III C-methyltransferase n=1 Tax=Pelomonas sp. SE-A7 TaxID=3054953 RepID=UPI00259CE405|nr:uroporphyrinogen-III C-methyltransferase [Pelomonas sp. SE-A7]MDM4764579.1 uroporphyrinogen-III C-methyltransferase [Pelomonas sp. SE-A7]